MFDQRRVATISELTAWCHIVEVRSFVLSGLFVVSNLLEFLGLWHRLAAANVIVALKQTYRLFFWPFVCNGLHEEAHAHVGWVPTFGGFVFYTFHTFLVFLSWRFTLIALTGLGIENFHLPAIPPEPCSVLARGTEFWR